MSAYQTKSRKTEIVTIKHHAIYLCLQNLNIGYALLGGFFNCDHATCIHAENKINGHLTWDKELKKELDDIQQMIINKGVFVDGRMTLGENYYYIDMSNITTMRIDDKKAIIFVGIEEKDMFEIRNKYKTKAELMEFQKTGMYILKKLDEQIQTTSNTNNNGSK